MLPTLNRSAVLSGVLAGAALISVALAGAAAFSAPGPSTGLSAGPSAGPAGGAEGTGAARAGAARRLQPGEVATVLMLIGISPEAMAASGISAAQCEDVFSAGTAACLQADRLGQLALAHKHVNEATERVVRPAAPGAVDGQGHQISLTQAQGELADLERTIYSFITSQLPPDRVVLLDRIRANSSWGVPAAYLTVNRADEDWMALRGALAAKRYAQQHQMSLSPRLSQIIAAAEADPVVQAALASSQASLGAIQQSWQSHDRP